MTRSGRTTSLMSCAASPAGRRRPSLPPEPSHSVTSGRRGHVLVRRMPCTAHAPGSRAVRAAPAEHPRSGREDDLSTGDAVRLSEHRPAQGADVAARRLLHYSHRAHVRGPAPACAERSAVRGRTSKGRSQRPSSLRPPSPRGHEVEDPRQQRLVLDVALRADGDLADVLPEVPTGAAAGLRVHGLPVWAAAPSSTGQEQARGRSTARSRGAGLDDRVG